MMAIVKMKGDRDKCQYGEYGVSGSALLFTAILSSTLGYTGGFHIVPSLKY